MADNDEEPAEPTSDIPTFGDLVDELEGPSPSEPDDGEPQSDAESDRERGAGSAADVETELRSIDGIGPAYSERLQDAGVDDIAALAAADAGQLSTAIDEPETRVADWIEQARERRPEPPSDTADLASAVDRFDRSLPSDLDALFDLVGGPTNILLRGPTESPAEYDVCARLLDRAPGPGRRRILVTTTQSPKQRLSVLRGYGAGEFDETVVIAVGDHLRGEDLEAAGGGDVTVEHVGDPRDLTRLGLVINKHLSDVDDTAGPVICFHSLSDLGRFVDLERLFRFLHVLTFRAEGNVPGAHYHLDPDAYSAEDLEVLGELFDFTVRFDGEGELSVDT